jgi:hypothetical protein
MPSAVHIRFLPFLCIPGCSSSVSPQNPPLESLSKAKKGTAYYTDSDSGSDDNSGLSPEEPWQSLAPVNDMTFSEGDQILLKADSSYTGSVKFLGSGTEDAPIVIDMYDAGEKPFIDSVGYLAGVHIENQDFIEIHNLRITSDGGDAIDERAEEERYGILVEATTSEPQTGFVIEGVEIHDIFASVSVESDGKNDTTNEGRGIRISSAYWYNPHLSSVVIEGNTIERTGFTGIQLTASWRTDPEVKITDVEILDNTLVDIGGPALNPNRVENLVIRGNTVDGSGSSVDERMHGRGSGLWPWRSDNILIEQNRFMHARGRQDSCGVHLDIGNTNVVVQHNLSLDNEGGFIEILGDNQNTTYRYNLSINDGARVKDDDLDQAPGRLFYLSSYAGESTANSGIGLVDTYIYNNTIYVSKDIESNFGITEMIDGLLVANNIFHIEGPTADIYTPWYDTLDDDDATVQRATIAHNLYLNKDTFPDTQHVVETEPIYGDASFVLTGSEEIEDYAPLAMDLVLLQGVEISQLEGDDVGLLGGMEVALDLLDNVVGAPPGFGAIEYTEPVVDTGQGDTAEDTATQKPIDTGTETEDTDSETEHTGTTEEETNGSEPGDTEDSEDCGCVSPGNASPLSHLAWGALLGMAIARRRDHQPTRTQ